jgi:hypothetical protein
MVREVDCLYALVLFWAGNELLKIHLELQKIYIQSKVLTQTTGLHMLASTPSTDLHCQNGTNCTNSPDTKINDLLYNDPLTMGNSCNLIL